MDNFRIPPSAAWYTQAVCTPDNGLLYITGNCSAIAYISSPENKENHDNLIIPSTVSDLKAVVCDPDWSKTKWFITLDEKNIVAVWNLESGKIIRAHKGHIVNDDIGPTEGGAMYITNDRQVLSIDRENFIKYCIVSNVYTILNKTYIPKSKSICMLKSSPYDSNIVAFGYRDGLISIANIKDLVILQKLRAHDTEIVSLEWMLITQNDAEPIEAESQQVVQEKRPIKRAENLHKPQRRDLPKPIVDEGDMFDIHSFDYLEEEFGTLSRPAPAIRGSAATELSDEDDEVFEEAAQGSINNEKFDFAEECQALRQQISEQKGKEAQDENAEVNLSDITRFIKDAKIKDGSVELSDENVEDLEKTLNENEESVASTIGSNHTADELEDIEKQISAVTISDVKTADGKIYLASGAQEPFVVIWDTENGNICDKLQLKVQHGKMPIPKPVCAVAWYRPNELIVNNPSGRPSKWSIVSDESCKIHKSVETKDEFIDKSVLCICSNLDLTSSDRSADRYVWTISMYAEIIARKHSSDRFTTIATISTLPIGINVIRESIHDPNRIAIAGNNKRINLLDLTTLKQNNIQMQPLISRIQGKVLGLAWHPENENSLCFSTNEGRIGVFDINKASNPPEIIKNFCGKNIYSISYKLGVDGKWILYTCNNKKLMMFSYGKNAKQPSGDGNYNFKIFSSNVSSVSSNQTHIAIGLADGDVKILTDDLKESWSKKISKKYICEIAWNPIHTNKLAIACADDKIVILELNSENNWEIAKELIGHTQTVAFVKWSDKNVNRLVSASFDGSVRVWDIESGDCIAWNQYDNHMFCAIFMPTDENFILCSGKSETMHIFDIRKHLTEIIGECKGKIKKKHFDIKWASCQHTSVGKLQQQEKKKIRNLEKKEQTNKIIKSPSDEIDSTIQTAASPYQLNFTTIFYLTNKEINRDPLLCLEESLNETETNRKKYLHEKLFSTRDDVRELLDEELNGHKISKTESIGNLLIPQINSNLKTDIMFSIETRKLTQQQIALAPSISFEFWRNCCLAYGRQCLHDGHVLQAIPYLLAIHQVTEVIDKLCEAHFYREAYAIAKLHKEPEETALFDSIAIKWIAHLENVGGFEGAALIAFLANHKTEALEILQKRKNPTEQTTRIIEKLQKLVDDTKENRNMN